MATHERIPGRRIIAVTGDDAANFLTGLVTNGPPGEGSCFSALLTPQGKVLFDFHMQKADQGFFIDIDAEASDAFMKRLTLYRLRAKVEISIDASLCACIDDSGVRAIRPAGDIPTARAESWQLRRIAAGSPEWGADFGSDEVFPMDVNYDLLGGVDYKKGCFVGQEVASRMKRKGAVRKRTLIASFDGKPPPKGTPITAGASTLGSIMSGADGAALALVRLDRVQNAEDNNETMQADGRALTLSRPPYMTAD